MQRLFQARKLIRAELDKYAVQSLEYDVYICFLAQPTQIGVSADNLRYLVITNEKDYLIYANAVREDFQQVLKKLSPSEQAKAQAIYDSAWELFDSTLV